jgi:hypothetical protein
MPGQQIILFIKNDFYTAHYSILAQNENRDATGINGLSLRCNSFFVTGHGASVSANGGLTAEDGINKYHGSNIQAYDAPAGNIFQDDFGSDKIATHFWNLSTIPKVIDYYYHNGIGSITRHKPGYNNDIQNNEIYTNGIFTYPNDNADWVDTLSCPSNFLAGGGSFKGKLLAAASNITTTTTTLDALVDAGNTTELTNEVNQAETSEGFLLRNELLATSPYLSDTVLQTASDKENVLTNPLIRDVLVANPQSAKNQQVLESIDERNNPMPDYMKQQILNGQTIASQKAQLEAELHQSKVKYNNALNHLNRQYMADSTINPLDSIIPLLSTAQSIEARYQLAGIYLQQNNAVALSNTLNNIVSDFDLSNYRQSELQNLTAYYNLLQNMHNSNRSIYELSESEKAALMDIKNDSVNLASALARNLLIYNGELVYEAPVILPDFELKSSLITEPVDIKVPKDEYASLNIYPNPTKDYIICEYDIKQDYKQAILIIIEAETGRSLQSIHLDYKQDSKTINLKGYKPGSYIITLQADNTILNNVKFNLIH